MRKGFHTRLPFARATSLWDGLNIGLYGGSFNPAHIGHRHVSREALKRLRLDALWWLVSPGNPLKDATDIAPLAERIVQARKMADHPRLFVTDVEAAFDSRFTVDTLKKLKRIHPRTNFVWLMGADNLADFHHWRDWRKIMTMLPVAVLARPGYSKRALASPAARVFRKARVKGQGLQGLVMKKPPCWAYVQIPQFDASATALRAAAHGDWGQAAVKGFNLDRAGLVKPQQQKE